MHQVRNSLKYVSWKDRKAVAASLRLIYTAPSEDAARAALTAFGNQWGTQYSAIAPSWENNWDRLTPFFDYPPEIRKVVYTSNAIESLNYSLRKVIKGRGAFQHDEAIRKLLYLGLRNVAKKWTMPVRDWKAALNQFIILYGDRVPVEFHRPLFTVIFISSAGDVQLPALTSVRAKAPVARFSHTFKGQILLLVLGLF